MIHLKKKRNLPRKPILLMTKRRKMIPQIVKMIRKKAKKDSSDSDSDDKKKKKKSSSKKKDTDSDSD